MMIKSNYGQFKKNSPISKDWCELVKDIKHMKKPSLIWYFNLIGHRWREQLFHIGKTLYVHIESDGIVKMPDFITEIKASEFYKAIESGLYPTNQPVGDKRVDNYFTIINIHAYADYTEADKLANAFYNLENKYKSTGNIPIDQIESIIEESGYGYVRELLANDEESLRLLVYLLFLIH